MTSACSLLEELAYINSLGFSECVPPAVTRLSRVSWLWQGEEGEREREACGEWVVLLYLQPWQVHVHLCYIIKLSNLTMEGWEIWGREVVLVWLHSFVLFREQSLVCRGWVDHDGKRGRFEWEKEQWLINFNNKIEWHLNLSQNRGLWRLYSVCC